MADTVYEYPNDEANRGYLGFTRFWKNGEDWIQITLISEDVNDANTHTYACMPFKKFAEAFQAVADNVSDTSKAWWHDLSVHKEESKTESEKKQ